MASLYDIRQNLRWLQYMAETAELTEEQEKYFEEVQIDRDDKIEEYVKIIKNLEADTQIYAAAIQEFQKKKKRAQKNIEYLRNEIIYDMNEHGENKKRAGLFTVGTARTAGKIVIEDEEAIPATFKKLKQEVSKSAIQEHFKETGELPEGVSVVKGVRLSIR